MGTAESGTPAVTALAWLALEVKYLERARAFYADVLELPVLEERAHEVAFAAGETALVLRRPTGIPRGGLHTHYALSIPATEYDDWWGRLESDHGYDLEEFVFGSAKSLYLYDPDGNCVELGQSDVEGPGIDGVFEVALEVESLDASEAFYADLGFETVDRGEKRRRIRMQGPMALELWEPQLGIADARGGVHVDLGFVTDEPFALADAVEDRACIVDRGDGDDETTPLVRGSVGPDDATDGATGDEDTTQTSESVDRGPDGGGRVVVRDPDGHHLAFFRAGGF